MLNLFYSISYSQTNLVPNPSFEVYASCPTNTEQIANAIHWTDPTSASSDYYNSCTSQALISVPFNIGGYQNARTGNAYAGFYGYVNSWPNFREYVQVLLLDSLKQGIVYRVSLYANLANIEKYAIDAFGTYFSSTAITGPPGTVLNYTPQVSNPTGNFLSDTLNWMEITGTFTATGGEKYLTIGNFKNDNITNQIVVNPNGIDSSSAYYYIDDISVYPDSVTSVNDLQVTSSKFQVYPNPNNGKMQLEYTLDKNDNGKLIIFNITGQVISSYQLETGITNMNINENQLKAGIYFYKIIVNNKLVKSDKLVIIK